MVKRTETFGKSLAAQSLIAFAGEDGLSAGASAYIVPVPPAPEFRLHQFKRWQIISVLDQRVLQVDILGT